MELFLIKVYGIKSMSVKQPFLSDSRSYYWKNCPVVHRVGNGCNALLNLQVIFHVLQLGPSHLMLFPQAFWAEPAGLVQPLLVVKGHLDGGSQALVKFLNGDTELHGVLPVHLLGQRHRCSPPRWPWQACCWSHWSRPRAAGPVVKLNTQEFRSSARAFRPDEGSTCC